MTAVDRRVAALHVPVLSLVCLGFGPLVYVSARAATLGMLVVALALLFARPGGASAALGAGCRRLLPFVPFLLWMLVSSLWALDAAAAASLALRLAVLFFAGAVAIGQFRDLPPDRLRRPVMMLALGLTIAAAAVAVDLPLGGSLGRSLHPPAPDSYEPALFYARAATLHAAFVIPLLAALIRLRATWLGVLHSVVTVLALFETVSLSAKTALVIGFTVLLAVYAVPRLRWAGLAALVLAGATLPALLPLDPSPDLRCWLIDNKPSALHRIVIWDFVAAHIHERPLFGWGLDAARRLPGGKDPLELRRCPPWPDAGRVVISSETLPLHPHNGILQVWLELGGVGMLLGLAPLCLGLVRVFRMPGWRTRPAQAVFAASLAAALSVALVSFGIWQEWFLAGLFLAAGPAVLAARVPAELPATRSAS